MEITNNQSKLVTLEGVVPPKVSVVATVKSDASIVAAQPDVQNIENNKEVVQSTDKVENQSEPQKQAENLHDAVSQINDHVQSLQRDLHFTVDDLTGKEVVTVIDRESEEVIRQIPSEEALTLARRLAENRDDRVQLFSILA